MDQEQGDWLTEYFAANTGTPAVDEAVTEAAAPEVEALPDSETPTPEPTPIPDPTPAPEPEPVAAEAAAPAPEPEPQLLPIDWNRPELQEALEAKRWRDNLQAQAAQIRQMQQAQGFQTAARELVEDDPERLQRFHGMVAQVVTPAVNERNQAVQQRDAIGKTFSAFWNAAKANLPDDQVQLLMRETEALMGVDDPHLMERMAFGKRDFERQYQERITAKDKQIADLQMQLAAKAELAAREASGADLVDSGGGATGGSREDRMRNADSMDAYWAALTGRD